jgi:predicted dehydrogenase
MRHIRVFQPRTYLSLDFIEQTLDIAETRPAAPGERPEIVRERLRIEPVKPLDEELAAFIACVREGHRPLVDGRVGLDALTVALQVRERICER